jgi:hypothetical protein
MSKHNIHFNMFNLKFLDDSWVNKNIPHNFIKSNFHKIRNEIEIYFKNNNDDLSRMIQILKLDGLNMRIISYYCHNDKKEWYNDICCKYDVFYGYGTPLTCFIRKNKIFLEEYEIYTTFMSLIFFMEYFKANIHNEILNNYDDIYKRGK